MILINAAATDLGKHLAGHTADSIADALRKAPENASIFILAPHYPALDSTIRLDTESLQLAKERNLRLFVEYPDQIAGLEFSAPEKTGFERTVITGDFFGPALPAGAVLAQHGNYLRRVNRPVTPLAAAAKVAGYRQAVFGIPTDAVPLLFPHPDYPKMLIATTGFSNFLRSRYAPMPDWRQFWNAILAFFDGDAEIPEWEMTVHPTLPPGAPPPEQPEKRAFQRSVRWFRQHALNLHTGLQVNEGFDSIIAPDGRQLPRCQGRGDCTGETALVFACDWAANRNPDSRDCARKIMEHLFRSPELCCLEPRHPCYGMLDFYENTNVFYGDDNCRAAISCLAATELLEDDSFDRAILRCLLSVLRTTGPLGFREFRLDARHFARGQNWDYYHRHECYNYRPHSQAWMWAGFLLGYRLSGHREFLDKARSGLRLLMEKYPDVTWTNGMSQEIARLLLPLAWLIRIEDTPAHREMLERVWRDVKALLTPAGAMLESVGDPATAVYPPATRNEDYGTQEAPLIQANGDPCCDLLYTVNFAFVGLQEAAIAAGRPDMQAAADRMADFLIRIQASSKAFPELDGAWLRGFDLDLWDYWGSSGDTGWGAWCVETGWTNSWIASTLALREQRRGLFDLARENRWRQLLPELLTEMSEIRPLPETFIAAGQAPGAE